jgi:HlyD family secretion protein
MDVPRKDAAKKRLIKRIIIGIVIVIALIPVAYYVGIPFTPFKGHLKPAAPGVELSTLWPDTVRRGPMIRDVRGIGTLVPEDTLLIPAQRTGASTRS